MRGQKKIAEENAKADGACSLLEELYVQVPAVQEEIDMGKSKGSNVTRAIGRINT